MNPNNPYIQTLITIRLKKLHREGFTRVVYQDLEQIFFKYIFKTNKRHNLNDISYRILNISVDEIIRYLSLDASIQSKSMALSDLLQGDS